MPRSILHPPSSVLAALFVPFVLFVVQPAAADDGWTLTTADFKRQPVSLRGFDPAGGVRVLLYDHPEPVTIPLDKFLQLDRGNAVQQVRGAWTLHLASGDRVGGEPLSIANDNLNWRSPAAGDLAIPLKDLRGLTKAQEPATFAPDRTDDTVFLTIGDKVSGIVTALADNKLTLTTPAGDPIPVDLATVKAVHFAAAKPPDAPGRAFRIQLADGSVVTAPQVKMADNKLTVTLSPGNDRPIDLPQVHLIEQLNGPVSWLSARAPAEVVYQPMFDVAFPPQMDRNYKGDRIKFQGREYARGIGVHAYCKLVYALADDKQQGGAGGGAGGYKVFRTQYALNEDAYKGKVTVRILVDDKVVHEQRDAKAGKLSPVILLDVANAKTLTLEAHPGGDPTTEDRTKWHIDTQARLNWLEPALLKEKPAAEAPKETPTPPTPNTTPSTTPATTQSTTLPTNTQPTPRTPAP